MFVKFLRAGTWARPNPAAPQFSADIDDVVEVSEDHAKELVKAGAAVIVDEPEDKGDGADDGDDGDGDDTNASSDGAGDEVKPTLAEKLKKAGKKKG